MNTCEILWGVLLVLVLMVIIHHLGRGGHRWHHSNKHRKDKEGGKDKKDAPAASKDASKDAPAKDATESHMEDAGDFESKLKNQLHEGFDDAPAGKTKDRTEYGDEDDDYTEHILSKSVNPEVMKNHTEFVKDRKKYSRQPAMPSDDLEFSYVNYQGLARRDVRIKQDNCARSVHGLKDSDYTRSNWNFTYG